MNFIRRNGFTPSASDLTQVIKSARAQFINYARDTGSIGQLTVAYDPPLMAYNVGLPLRVRVNFNNAGRASLDAGAGRYLIKRPDGFDLQRNDLIAGQVSTFVWDGTQFQLFGGISGLPSGSIIRSIKIPYVLDTSTVVNTVIAPFDPEITEVEPGDIVEVKLANTITGTAPVMIQVNALPPVPIKDRWGANLSKWAAVAGEIMLMIYHPLNYWQLVRARTYEGVWVFDKAGQHTWHCPENVHEVAAEIWGAGASGTNRQWLVGTTAVGGPSGGYAWGVYPVEPGKDYAITIGAGGPALDGQIAAHSGGLSSFDTLVAATGGSWFWIGMLWDPSGRPHPWHPDPEYAYAGIYPGRGGVGRNGMINLHGGAPWYQMNNSFDTPGPWQSGFGMWNWDNWFGYGSGAPRGGGVAAVYTNGTWPGGGGGGGSRIPGNNADLSLMPGAGADGGLIITARN